jgi:hypothetical protein
MFWNPTGLRAGWVTGREVTDEVLGLVDSIFDSYFGPYFGSTRTGSDADPLDRFDSSESSRSPTGSVNLPRTKMDKIRIPNVTESPTSRLDADALFLFLVSSLGMGLAIVGRLAGSSAAG